jgi:CAAX protease family protein
MSHTGKTASYGWTLLGLAIALASLPIIIATFTVFDIPRTTANLLIREIVIFALAGFLLALIRSKEKLGWNSVGLERPAIGNSALWMLITIVGVVLAMAAAFGLIHLFGWSFGESDATSSHAVPLWLTLLIVIRAGFVEELFYRGYAIERLESFTGSRLIAAGLPLLIFATFHYRQGRAGILIALLIGAVVTAVYMYKRNLWVTITTHFLVDFVPNVLVPLISPDA